MKFNFLMWAKLLLVSLFGFDSTWSYWPDKKSEFHARKAYFSSETQVFRVKIGGEVTFPCVVENLGGDVITWSTGERLLTAGPVKVYNEERLIHNHNGSQITLRDVQPRDKGEFSCQVNNIRKPMVLTHTLDVLIPPRIVARKSEVSVTVTEEAELECVAHGNPQPKISWRRKDGRPLPGVVVGHRLHLLSVGREETGMFQCMAENGVHGDFGDVVYDEVMLHVNFPPQIEVEKRQYFPKIREERLQLSCRVLGEPSPDVNWKRGKRVLSGQNQKYKMSTNSDTGMHMLSLLEVTEEDLGNYTCHATNHLGWAEETITVSGKPLRPVILPGNVESRRSYRLRWLIESAFPIRGHNIYFRLSREGENHLHCENPLNNCMMLRLEGESSSHDDVVFNIKKDMDVVLRDLKPDSKYILQVQTINDFGSSEWSALYKFDTYPEPVAPLAPWSPFSSSWTQPTFLSYSLLLMSVILVVYLI